MKSARNHQAYWAFLGHRLSGLALALFLPAHFYVLAMALDEARLDAFLKLAEMPAMKLGEWGLVLLLTLHMFFGLRLLVLELLPWNSPRDARVAWIGWGFAISMATGLAFLAGVI
ncbi:succinate dehydrogenase [Achromobacter denitrificans]|uniref:Succinate dehydrogenase cytochrome b556 subunit n=1 Tax=Achromobacter denitrificans TaxID=32002 RepID=A0A6J5BHC5_ACHDE|nr:MULTISPECIES: succinate dehydrogenase [Achromobacter]ASC65726.1 succinate dehydrogenase [Achromobacter denitrificans]MBV2158700.1 succinate dehydrogenase [Achromobacter denitrificans]MDF3852408.1 succinate dehydrogenase [Achromobacter denitrificans]MDF3943116.1 succinate dehydrogenase [Achromobacter denitrificans]MDX3878751.1 succinate dehydrogenase [Achromobacter sp.]